MRKLMTKRSKAMALVGLVGCALIQTSCAQSNSDGSVSHVTAEKAVQDASQFKVKYVDAVGAKALLDAKADVVVLDIRTPKEVEKGHIEGAVFADFYAEDFSQQLTKLDRTAHYVVHCGSGGRSTKALTTLEELGFTNITHMDGGLRDWNKADLPLTQP